MAEGAGHHLLVFTSPPPRRRRREERMKSQDGAVGLSSEMSFVRLLISILHIHECPADSEKEDGGDRGSISVCV